MGNFGAWVRRVWSGAPTGTLLHLLLILQSRCQSLALLQRVCLHDPLQHWTAVHRADVHSAIIPGAVVHVAFSPPHLMTVWIGTIPSKISNLERERDNSEVWVLQRLLQRRQAQVCLRIGSLGRLGGSVG